MKQLATVVAGLAVLVLALATGALAGTPGGPGAVYALTNSAQGNAVAVYDRGADGHLSSPRLYPTAGLGSGAGGLGSQGGVALTADGHVLLAVNAGSNTISAFAVTSSGLQLLDVVPSFGTQPVSIAVRRNVAFVVNATSLSIHGYSIDKRGLTPIAGSGQALSPSANTPSQIASRRTACSWSRSAARTRSTRSRSTAIRCRPRRSRSLPSATRRSGSTSRTATPSSPTRTRGRATAPPRRMRLPTTGR